MKILKIAPLFFTLCGLLFSACSEESVEAVSLKINRMEIIFETDIESESTFEIYSNTEWKVLPNNSWITVSPEKGSGDATITVKTKCNDDGAVRKGSIDILAGNLRENITVRQSQTINLSVSSEQINLPDVEPGQMQTSLAFSIESDVDWTITVPENSWYTVKPLSGRGGRKSIAKIETAVNNTTAKREGKFTVKAGTRSKDITVKQAKGADYLHWKKRTGEDAIMLSDKGSFRKLQLYSSYNWTITIEGNWFSVDQTSGAHSYELKVSASENTTGAERTGKLIITADRDNKKIEVPVKQGYKGNYWEHGDYLALNKHTEGNGVILIIIGDGFDRQDNQKDGFNESVCRQLSESFLSNPIIRDFKNLFDIYAVFAESDESIIMPGVPTQNGYFNSGKSPNFGKANQFATSNIPELVGRNDRTIIFVGNGMIGGYAYFKNDVVSDVGFGIYSTDEGVNSYWMSHECIGHGFASLADEYSSTPGYMGGVQGLLAAQARGKAYNMANNVSAYEDWARTPWKEFQDLPGYEEVGHYLGGWYEYEGVWRSEKHSVMLNWDEAQYPWGKGPYYNAASRWIIYRRIHDAAGIKYTFEDFLEYDKAYNVR